MKSTFKKVLVGAALSVLCVLNCKAASTENVDIVLTIPALIDFTAAGNTMYSQTVPISAAASLVDGDPFGEIKIPYVSNVDAKIVATYVENGQMKNGGTDTCKYKLKDSTGEDLLTGGYEEVTAGTSTLTWKVHLDGANPGVGKHEGEVTLNIEAA